MRWRPPSTLPGDFAQAYVIAHEVGHHVQTLTGVTQEVTAAASQNPSIADELSIPLELQADCLAGVWAHSTYERGLLESGDLEEGLAAAAAVGDDRIQEKTTGRIDPETWTHGTSEQRAGWFLRGFEGARPRPATHSEASSSAGYLDAARASSPADSLAAVSAAVAGDTRTGHGAVRMTLRDVLPRSTSLSLPWPCAPTTSA